MHECEIRYIWILMHGMVEASASSAEKLSTRSHNHPSYATQVASASVPPNQIVKLKWSNLMVERKTFGFKTFGRTMYMYKVLGFTHLKREQ
jgi:hypothetical protein